MAEKVNRFGSGEDFVEGDGAHIGITYLDPKTFLPTDVPSTSPSQIMYQGDMFPTTADRQHCQPVQARVNAHKDAQFGVKPLKGNHS